MWGRDRIQRRRVSVRICSRLFSMWADDRAGCSSVLVFCSPDEEFEENRSKVDALLGQAVVDLSGVGCDQARR